MAEKTQEKSLVVISDGDHSCWNYTERDGEFRLSDEIRANNIKLVYVSMAQSEELKERVRRIAGKEGHIIQGVHFRHLDPKILEKTMEKVCNEFD
ncbi:hypothetical protein GCK32_018955 [Trichostrongylus colubriformis]|uniref:VWFA domain-containing protein n=1 Tax=Trichostrongylus colubriformis TaxID=6319 RepID=A0AAN8IS59_TRICO